LSFSRLDEASFLSFDATRIVPEKAQVFEGGSSRDIKALNSFGDSGDASFTLASQTTSNDFDINIKQTSV
jgi:hypothetical protein